MSTACTSAPAAATWSSCTATSAAPSVSIIAIRARSWEPVDEPPPRCARCGSPLRPDVVWFGEALPEAALRRAREAAAHCDLFLSVGTSNLVHPAAELPFIAGASGATVIEINPDATPVSRLAAFVLREKAGQALPAIAAAMLD